MMHRKSRSSIFLILAIALLSACNHIPDHARYIPKDAVVVAGINLKSLGKKIAWNVITGSKLFKEMKARIPEKNTKEAVSGIEKAGLDFANTFYVYVKTDNRFKGGNRVTGLIPLDDAGQWEAYIKRVFPKVEIKQHGDRKEASLGNDMYVGWSKNLLIIINVMPPTTPDYADMAMGGRGDGKDNPVVDMTTIAAEMDKAFLVTTENSIIGNKHFTKLETDGHDITFWLNYDQLMQQMSGDMAEKMGLSVSGALWKDAALASGINFIKGRITGDIHYYLSPEVKDIGIELGAVNADKDMIERLPNQNMDMIAAIHLSPKGVKAILEKMNLLGLANLGLSTQDMSVDDILNAFTGDMAFVMNDFSLRTENVTDIFMGQTVVRKNQKPTLSMSYVMKINNKENFKKLLKMAKDMGLPSMGNGYVVPIDDKDSVYIMMNDQYAIATNKYPNATGFLQGGFKSQKLPETVSSKISGHPWVMYFDVQQFCKNIDAGISQSANDSLMINESKKLLNNISLAGGEFKENAFEYHLDVNFMNTEENSLIALMDYGMKMSDANNQ